MTNFCTLFDSNYLGRGLALYESLCRVCPSFHLYILAFDEKSKRFLKEKNYPFITVISLDEFEDQELLKVKPGRSAAEYCWTCTPSAILYCIQKYNLSSCTYIDADMIFYSDPKVLIDEMGNDSVLISEHRYTRLYDQSKTSGIYCVQFMCFKNTGEGMTVLQWWRNACLEWCYARYEDGKFGDQKYLDTWRRDFKGIHVLQHEGGGIAPWNMQQYNFVRENNKMVILNKKTGMKSDLVFIHFHGLKFYTHNTVSFCPPIYELSREVKTLFYMPYVDSLKTISQSLPGISFDPNGARGAAPSVFRWVLKYYKGFIKASPKDFRTIFQLKNYNFKRHLHLFKY